MDTCMLDECVQQGFDKDNVQEAVLEDQEEKLGFGAIEDVGEFDNACVVDQPTTVFCDCRAAMPTEAKLICRPGQTCQATMRDDHGQMGEQCASSHGRAERDDHEWDDPEWDEEERDDHE